MLQKWDTDFIALISICYYVKKIVRKAIESVFRVNSIILENIGCTRNVANDSDILPGVHA